MENPEDGSAVVNNQRGQGTVEYILILVVVVAIALGVLYQFHDAFGKYIDNYFGDYLACLLETGELPNLGAPAGTGCDKDFEEYSLENGRPKREDFGAVAATGTSAGDGEDGGGQRRRRSGGTGGDFGRRQTARRAANDSGKADVPVKKDSKSEGLTFADGSKGRNSYDRYGNRIKTVPAKTSETDGKEKEEKEKEKEKKKTAEQGGEAKQKGTLIPIKKKIANPEAPDESDPFTFGKFLRYLIIGGIIIAIVVFIGGQALQLSKEWD